MQAARKIDLLARGGHTAHGLENHAQTADTAFAADLAWQRSTVVLDKPVAGVGAP